MSFGTRFEVNGDLVTVMIESKEMSAENLLMLDAHYMPRNLFSKNTIQLVTDEAYQMQIKAMKVEEDTDQTQLMM